jgi:hypothetical protein
MSEAIRRSLKDFTKVLDKPGGLQKGGIYQEDYSIFVTDNNCTLTRNSFKNSYVIKYLNTEQTIKEYIANRILKLFIVDNIDELELINKDSTKSILVASKIIPSFVNFKEIMAKRSLSLERLINEYDDTKPILNHELVKLAGSLIADMDMHWGNIGIVEFNDRYEVITIDHGLSLSLLQWINTIPMVISNFLLPYYAETIDYKSIDKAITKISKVKDDVIRKEINEICNDIYELFTEKEVNRVFLFDENCYDFLSYIIERKHYLETKIKTSFRIEEAIVTDDINRFNELVKENDIGINSLINVFDSNNFEKQYSEHYPLYFAAKWQKPNITKFLLLHGVNITETLEKLSVDETNIKEYIFSIQNELNIVGDNNCLYDDNPLVI